MATIKEKYKGKELKNTSYVSYEKYDPRKYKKKQTIIPYKLTRRQDDSVLIDNEDFEFDNDII
jgi:hypothetical protein